MLLFLLGCATQTPWAPCACDGDAHGAAAPDGPCLCLELGDTAAPEVEWSAEFFVSPAGDGDGSEASPWSTPDFDVLDAALAQGDVAVRFSSGVYPERLELDRGDTGANTLLFDGAFDDARAVMPGITTGYADRSQDHLIIRGFEVTGSRDKGIYFRAGSDVVIEDNVVHGNAGSPSIHLDYANRSGLPSSRFVVRGNHVFEQRGECIYIGGAEGTGAASHGEVVVSHNLVHDCVDPDGKADGINIKDGIAAVTVRRNVVFHTDWGLELGSGGLYEGNLVFDTRREGIQLNDGFGAFSGAVLRDNAVLEAGHDGLYAAPDTAITELSIERFTSIDAQGAGMVFGGVVEATVAEVVLVGEQAFFGWDHPEVTVSDCRANGSNDAPITVSCAPVSIVDVSVPAGPDQVFFTADDPWLIEGGAAL